MNNHYQGRYYRPGENGTVMCDLCPHHCVIAEARVGRCQVRCNRGQKLYSLVYGHPAAIQIDPIEKKPLSCYKPGSSTFSIGTFGCNLSCVFCQNDHLSRHGSSRCNEYPFVMPQILVDSALKHGCQSIAFTYNEPTVFIEYAIDIAQAARKAGLGTVLVSNGFIESEPRADLYPLIDAANIDIKGMSDDFYHTLCGGRLQTVLDSCVYFKKECGGHLEITNLLIPGYNDQPAMIQKLLDFVARSLGLDTPLHFSAYFPAGGFTAPATPRETLLMARDMALDAGLQCVKLGNLR